MNDRPEKLGRVLREVGDITKSVRISVRREAGSGGWSPDFIFDAFPNFAGDSAV